MDTTYGEALVNRQPHQLIVHGNAVSIMTGPRIIDNIAVAVMAHHEAVTANYPADAALTVTQLTAGVMVELAALAANEEIIITDEAARDLQANGDPIHLVTQLERVSTKEWVISALHSTYFRRGYTLHGPTGV